MTPAFDHNLFILTAGLSVVCLLVGVGLGRWFEALKFINERHRHREEMETFEIEREAARRLLADLYRHTRGRYGHNQVRAFSTADPGLRVRH